MLQSISIGADSSDEDVPKPMNFSALTKALLEDKATARPRSPPQVNRRADFQRSQVIHSRQTSEVPTRGETPPRGTLRITRRTPPPSEEPEAHRVVHLSGSKRSGGELRRTRSTLDGSSRLRADTLNAYVTPAPQPRSRLDDHQRSASSVSGERIHHESGSVDHLSNSSGQRNAQASSSSYASSFDHGVDGDIDPGHSRSKNATGNVQGSMRVRRPPMGTGTLLRGAPVRRGVRRMPSAEGASPIRGTMTGGDELKKEVRDDLQSEQDQEDLRQLVESAPRQRDFATSNEAQISHANSQKRDRSPFPQPTANEQRFDSSERHLRSKEEQRPDSKASKPPPAQPVYRVPDLPFRNAISDQENDPPPTFKRNKDQAIGVLGNHDKITKQPARTGEDRPKPAQDIVPPQAEPKRNALQPLSQNTPLRPAPPPPKMSVVDAATGAAGASTVKAKKKRSHVIVNGKLFEIRGRIGRGGSSNVYRVMAENDKMFALKKVNLEDCNEDSVRGYKGEIDLLKKLENEERVVRLFDYEVNEQKQSLSVLMEMGESDLNKVLATRLSSEDATLDLSFTRHYWREMLCCVASVHAYDIVHSDLKPANFLLAGGRLKLIDFGIANAIDTENTVNVHRETNVGTPNYMSPESLQDTNAGADSRQPGGDGHAGRGSTKLMKLGKPSDVWSLGCILYQMTYGKAPFAHIQSAWNRVCAIINPNVHIQYPTKGIGGTYVPSSLRRLLQRCLDRDQKRRPTVAQLLDPREPFLNPDAEGEDAVPMTEALLGQILMKVVQRCRDEKRGFPTDGELLKTYPRGYMENIRTSLERG